MIPMFGMIFGTAKKYRYSSGRIKKALFQQGFLKTRREAFRVTALMIAKAASRVNSRRRYVFQKTSDFFGGTMDDFPVCFPDVVIWQA